MTKESYNFIEKHSWLEYLGVVALWLLIFGKNIFSNLLFVDYVPATGSYLHNTIVSGGYVSIISIYSILREIFGLLGIGRIFFVFIVLAGMLFSFRYIKKIGGKYYFLFALIYFFNPFVYSRIMIGQVGIVLAYLMMPVYLYYMFNMFNSEFEKRALLKCVLAFAVIGALTPHFFIIEFIMFLVGCIWLWFYKNENRNWSKLLKNSLIFILLILILSAYWLQGLFANPILGNIDSRHEDFFAPKASSGISAVAKIIGMWGFWREGSFLTTYNVLPSALWYVIIILLVVLLLNGYYTDNKDKKAKFFYSLFWLGLILGVGISHPYTGKLFDLLFNYLPFFNGFRDSHKFVVFIALSYAYFLPRALGHLIDKIGKKKLVAGLLTGLFVLGIIAYCFPFVGLHGQVRGAEYPSSYKELGEFLKEEEVKGKVIYLPWQEYLSYSWTKNVSSDGRIVVPMNSLMPVEIYVGPDDYGGKDKFDTEIESCLKSKDKNCLKNKGVEYILKDKCATFPDSYSWVDNSGLEKKFESECVDAYYVGGVSRNESMPLRFITGILISLIGFLYMAIVLGNTRRHKQQLTKQKSIQTTI